MNERGINKLEKGGREKKREREEEENRRRIFGGKRMINTIRRE
jgi:hypothetical protein